MRPLVLIALVFALCGSVLAEGLTSEQGEAILEELRAIRKELGALRNQRAAAPAKQAPRPAARPATASVGTAGDPAKGDENAPVTLVEFSDFQCPYCKRFYSTTLGQIQAKYIDTGKVRLVYRDLPLPFHQDARGAAQAAHCAGDQGKYWEMHDAIFSGGGLKRADLLGHAGNLGLDMDAFGGCLGSEKHMPGIDADIADAGTAQISGTPTFVVGRTTGDVIEGKRLVGARPFASFEAEIEALLGNSRGQIP